jgi:hypothetical protein
MAEECYSDDLKWHLGFGRFAFDLDYFVRLDVTCTHLEVLRTWLGYIWRNYSCMHVRGACYLFTCNYYFALKKIEERKKKG